KRKKELHEEIGNAMEELFKDSLSEHYEILADHYFLGENYPKSIDYLKLSSNKAEKTATLNDAIAYTKKRVICLERLPQTGDVQKKIIDARTTLGLYMIQMNYHAEAGEAINPIIDLAKKLNYKRRLCQIYTILGSNYLFTEDDCLKAIEVLEEAQRILKETQDLATALFATFWYGVALGLNCEFEKSADYFQRALDINLAAKSFWGIAIAKSSLALFSYFYSGKIDLEFQTTMGAVHIAEESGDVFSKANSYTSHGISCLGKGLLHDAQKYLLMGMDFCERINFNSWNGLAHFHLAETHFEMGDFLRSKGHYEKGSRVWESNQLLPSWVNLQKVGLVRSKVMNRE
ncbi:MAG: hypothetical protein ACXU9K_12160, partial [Thermodesulfobacteriota bacterium]